MNTLSRVASLLAALLLVGCVAAPPSRQAMDAVAGAWLPVDGAASRVPPGSRWHTICFRMPFDSADQPVWARDLLLADRVLAPVLTAHRADIALWRFHRRAARDAAGHQFSLLMYTTDAAYAAMTVAIDADPLLGRLRHEGQIDAVKHDCRATQSRPEPEATSDPGWDRAIRRSWPYFIMGASASWLALVRELAATPPPGTPSFDSDPVAYYAAVETQLSALWADQGQHAYLHHLSGIYGYRPLRIGTWMAF